jgi:hypothetical protein
MDFDRDVGEVIESAEKRLVMSGIPRLASHDGNDGGQVALSHPPDVKVRHTVVLVRLHRGLNLIPPLVGYLGVEQDGARIPQQPERPARDDERAENGGAARSWRPTRTP